MTHRVAFRNAFSNFIRVIRVFRDFLIIDAVTIGNAETLGNAEALIKVFQENPVGGIIFIMFLIVVGWLNRDARTAEARRDRVN